MRQFLFLLLTLTFVIPSINFAQQCYPIGFQVKGEPWHANQTNDATNCVVNTAPGNVVNVTSGTLFNFIFDPQIGTADSVPIHPTVMHAAGWTPPANPIASGDFDISISPNNHSKIVMRFTPGITHQLAVGDTICYDYTFNTGNPVTAPVTFYSSVPGFGQNLPSNTITVQ